MLPHDHHRIFEVPKLTIWKANHTGPGSVLQATIRVIGAAGVGKSLFIKAASITKDGQKLSDTVSVVVDRCLCKLTFQEVPLELLEDKDGHDEASAAITRAADHHQPRGRQHSGTIILFDVMNKDSLYGVPDLLSMLHDGLKGYWWGPYVSSSSELTILGFRDLS